MILAVAHSMLQFHRKFSTESVSSERRHGRRCNRRDADGDGVLPAADGARAMAAPPAGNGGIVERLAPVSRGRAGGGDEGALCGAFWAECTRARHGAHFRPRNCNVEIYMYSARENAT